jgi:hypothetical protein
LVELFEDVGFECALEGAIDVFGFESIIFGVI